MIEHSAEIGKLAAALVAAQGQMHGAVKDKKNPAFKSSYASLESVIEEARPALNAAGLAFTQAPGHLVDGTALEITTMLIHGESGQWMRSTLHILLGKRDPQGVGSAITYGLRYGLMATLGLPPVDDDGEGAMDRSKAAEEAPAPKPKAKSRDAYKELQQELDACETLDQLAILWRSPAFKNELKQQPLDWQDMLLQAKDERKAQLTPPANGVAHVAPNFDRQPGEDA